MNRFTGVGETPGWGGEGETRVDLSAHDDELVVVADLPGFDREEIDLSLDGDRLVIAASHEATADETEHEEQYIRRERRTASVRRGIDLPVAVDADGASANYTNGMLTVTLPKTGESEGHGIDVQ